MTDRPVDEPLRDALRDLAHQAAPRLLADAFDDAYDEARSILRKLMVDALLQEAGGRGDRQIGPGDRREGSRGQTVAAARSGDAGVYVYGFAFSDCGRDALPVGVNGYATSSLEDRDVIAIISEISGAPLGWDCGEGGDLDLTVLGTRAQEHERVLQSVLDSGPVIPMRFGTVYPSREAVLETLRSHHGAIHAALGALDGKAEWGLTVTCERGEEVPADRPAADPLPAEAAGRAYLGRREAEKAAAERSARQRREVATALHRAIQEVAARSVAHPARRTAGARDRDRDVLLKASYLVDKADQEQFAEGIVDALESAADLGLTGELTGPWPPYNFCRLELGGARA